MWVISVSLSCMIHLEILVQIDNCCVSTKIAFLTPPPQRHWENVMVAWRYRIVSINYFIKSILPSHCLLPKFMLYNFMFGDDSVGMMSVLTFRQSLWKRFQSAMDWCYVTWTHIKRPNSHLKDEYSTWLVEIPLGRRKTYFTDSPTRLTHLIQKTPVFISFWVSENILQLRVQIWVTL